MDVTHKESAAPLPAKPHSDPIDTVRFMFAVGIECSCPKIAGGERVDQLRDTGHYELWQRDLELVRDLGLRYLRYGPPIYRVWRGKVTADAGYHP